LLKAGETLIPARIVREKLGLRSADFTWKTEGDFVTFETKGYGHAVGMCQYGARGMAENGYSYQVILGHYYGGSAIEKVSQGTVP
jgi:stage II sporulation protein D